MDDYLKGGFVTRKLSTLALILLVAASLGSAKEKTGKGSGESGGWGFF
jgi:hypothetical protein